MDLSAWIHEHTHGTNMDVSAWIHEHVRPFDGAFVPSPATEKTSKLWDICKDLLQQEFAAGGVLSIDETTPSDALSHAAWRTCKLAAVA